ncbi:MAG: hypothetical protein K8H88_08580, partial [Sandaracinaceae bacterium]|nr:hypothetical protein [Sandaracinaceae bacterium]
MRRLKITARTVTVICGLFIALSSSCDSTEEWAVERPTDPSRFDELRRRQYLRTVNTATGEEQTWDLQTSDDFWDLVQSHCETELLHRTPEMDGEVCDYQPSETCREALCGQHGLLCVANLLEEMASVTDDPLEMTDAVTGVTWNVPAQATATNAELHWTAAVVARWATAFSAGFLRGTVGLPGGFSVCSESELQLTWGPAGQEQTLGRSLAMVIVESVDIGREATQAGVRDHLALADGHYSTAATTADAARLATSAPTMSRAHAAHLLIGGEQGLGGLLQFTGQTSGDPLAVSFCTANTLSPRGQAALAVFRDAALPPTLMLDPTTAPLSQLLIGGTDNVRLRLKTLYGLDGTTLHATDATLFAEDLGLDLDAFQEAREYWTQEYRAFARSATQQLPDRTLAGGATMEDLYAATALPPQSPSPEYYAALARYAGTPYSSSSGVPDLFYSIQSLSHALDFAYTQVEDLIGASGSFTSATVRSEVLDPLATLAARASRERPARLRARSDSTTTYTSLLHDGSQPSADFLVTWSTDVLSCAVRGSIEAQPCSWGPAWAGTLYEVGGDAGAPGPETGFAAETKWEIPSRFFWVLRRRAGMTGESPGAYEVVVGHSIPQNAAEHEVPVIPELSTQAGDLLTPSTDLCSHSRETCAGVDFDTRLPLENELSDNGDNRESSWQYFLNLAEIAAREADELGQQVIREGLENDLRSEQAAARLEELCGGAVDLSALVDADLSESRDGACGTGGTCNPGYECNRGQCIRDPVSVLADASGDAARRLRECLSEDTQIPYVTLGAEALCFWVQDGADGEICPSDPNPPPGGRRCPEILANFSGTATPADCLTAFGPLSAGYEWVAVSETLGYFSSDAPVSPSATVEAPCEALRHYRDLTYAALSSN